MRTVRLLTVLIRQVSVKGYLRSLVLVEWIFLEVEDLAKINRV